MLKAGSQSAVTLISEQTLGESKCKCQAPAYTERRPKNDDGL